MNKSSFGHFTDWLKAYSLACIYVIGLMLYGCTFLALIGGVIYGLILLSSVAFGAAIGHYIGLACFVILFAALFFVRDFE